MPHFKLGDSVLNLKNGRTTVM